MFLDLAYDPRAMLRQMGYDQPDVVGLLAAAAAWTGAARASAAARQRLRRPDRTEPLLPRAASVFTARYHEREAPVQDADPPFGRCFLLPLARRGRRDGGDASWSIRPRQFLDRDLLFAAWARPPTWAGPACRGRRQRAASFYQTFGLYKLAWPRRDLVARGRPPPLPPPRRSAG